MRAFLTKLACVCVAGGMLSGCGALGKAWATWTFHESAPDALAQNQSAASQIAADVAKQLKTDFPPAQTAWAISPSTDVFQMALLQQLRLAGYGIGGCGLCDTSNAVPLQSRIFAMGGGEYRVEVRFAGAVWHRAYVVTPTGTHYASMWAIGAGMR